jgi:hypothetical protein
MVRLIPPVGCDECSYGETRYKVHEAGYVDVPQEAVDGLTHVGGFVLAPDQPASVDGAGADVPPAVDASLGNPDPVE